MQKLRTILDQHQTKELLYSSQQLYSIQVDEITQELFRCRRIVRKYMKSNLLKDKLLVNSIIIINNIAKPSITNAILYSTFTDEEFKIIKAVLVGLNIYTERFGLEVEVDNCIIDLLNDRFKRYSV